MDFSILLHFLMALAASFIGYLPFGTVNLSVIDTTISHGLRAALVMALGASLIEIIGFLLGVSAGRFLSLMVWGYLSQALARRVKTIGLWIDKIIGGILIAIGIFQGVRLVV